MFMRMMMFHSFTAVAQEKKECPYSEFCVQKENLTDPTDLTELI